MTIPIGTEGHVSFRLLTPTLGESIWKGETDCHLAKVVSNNGDGTVNCAGWNHRGEPRSWIDVAVGLEPAEKETSRPDLQDAVDASFAAELSEVERAKPKNQWTKQPPVAVDRDPAGHTFHALADCPWGR
jgi:hypothetical protein